MGNCILICAKIWRKASLISFQPDDMVSIKVFSFLVIIVNYSKWQFLNQTQKTSSGDFALWGFQCKCVSPQMTNRDLLGSTANRGALIWHPNANAQQGPQCGEHPMFHLFRWLMSSPIQCGEKLSVWILSIQSLLNTLPQAYKLWPLPDLIWKPVQWKTGMKVGLKRWKSEGHMFNFISPAATIAGQKLPFARSTTNINISNLLCYATANRSDAT